MDSLPHAPPPTITHICISNHHFLARCPITVNGIRCRNVQVYRRHDRRAGRVINEIMIGQYRGYILRGAASNGRVPFVPFAVLVDYGTRLYRLVMCERHLELMDVRAALARLAAPRRLLVERRVIGPAEEEVVVEDEEMFSWDSSGDSLPMPSPPSTPSPSTTSSSTSSPATSLGGDTPVDHQAERLRPPDAAARTLDAQVAQTPHTVSRMQDNASEAITWRELFLAFGLLLI